MNKDRQATRLVGEWIGQTELVLLEGLRNGDMNFSFLTVEGWGHDWVAAVTMEVV